MKIINYTIILFFIAIIKVLADDGIELEKIKKENKDFLVLYQPLSSNVYINELEYQKIKKKADNFKNTNYMVYENVEIKNSKTNKTKTKRVKINNQDPTNIIFPNKKKVEIGLPNNK